MWFNWWGNKMITIYERRMQEIKNLFDDLKKESLDFKQPKYFTYLNSVIMNCRTVTIVLQKELSKNEGFKDWYSKKVEEIKSLGFSDFKDMRNVIEKEGKQVVKGESIEWVPTDKSAHGSKEIGTIIRGGVKEPLYGFTKRTHYFGDPRKQSLEVICKLSNYIDYLEKLCQEAKERFQPQD